MIILLEWESPILTKRERERINIIVLNERGVSIFIDSFISLGKRHVSTLKDLFLSKKYNSLVNK